MYLSLAVICGIILVKFLIAIVYSFFIGWNSGVRDSEPLIIKKPKNETSMSENGLGIFIINLVVASTSKLLHTLVMVTVYSESEEAIRTSLESVYHAEYPSTHKTMFIVADGLIQGSGNSKKSHEYVLDMMEIDQRFKLEDPANGGDATAYNYVAIAGGNKRKNFAKVYAGWYKPVEKEGGKIDRVPIILVVKVGNDEEMDSAKPGNRGKRDSQVLLMTFLRKIMFDERMTALEFEIFYKLWAVCGFHPEKYETVLLIDADTSIEPKAIDHLIANMIRDPNIIGSCGDTQVKNKLQSWVTMIQVYEYFISHHLSKAFESFFGCIHI